MIKVVADSVCDVPKSYKENYNINILPLKIIQGEKEFKDGIDIFPEDMFELMSQDVLPKTSQITPFDYIEYFKELLADTEELIVFTVSSKLSGTYNSAKIASMEFPDKKIEVIDSKGITLGYGLLVIEAAKMAKNGKKIEEIVKRIEKMRDSMEYIIMVDDIEYLYKGGRISKTQYMLANFFNIKPIVTMKDGEIVVKEKFRGSRKAIKWMMEYAKNIGQDLNGKCIGINHANNKEYQKQLHQGLLDEFKPSEIVLSEVGCSVATYAGLSAVAFYFERED